MLKSVGNLLYQREAQQLKYIDLQKPNLIKWQKNWSVHLYVPAIVSQLLDK